MEKKIKSVSKILNFFQKLDTYKNNRIFVYTDKQSALNQANICDQRQNTLSKIDGSLVAVKPNLKVKSFPFSGGIEEFKNIISEFDDPIIKIIKNNGGIIIGLTNMDEAAFGGDTSSSFFGRCLNPINQKLSVGGSSGGSAAAISSGLVNYALGTDTMGSVRIPASYCGIVGFKPSSLILNNKVFVPIMNSSWDDDAISVYQEALPEHEILGFTGTWQSTDALHCRVRGIPDTSYIPFQSGDINLDELINVQDVVLVINYILGQMELNQQQINLADLNNDQSINVQDIILLVNIILD